MIDLFLLFSYLFFVGTGIYALWLAYSIPEKPTLSTTVFEMVSIIVPVRNQERTIKATISSLLQLDYPDFEIIVVEGNSTDSTPEILREIKGITLIQEPPLPEGWVGKPWACHVGQQHATGNLLLFTDADTIHSPHSLRTTVSQLSNSSGFTSLITTQIFSSIWEHMVTLMLLIIAAASFRKGNAELANGQYLLFTRETYTRIGGHQAVANSVIEDLELARTAIAKGVQPLILYEPGLVFVRMYQGLFDLIEGFTKNIALGMKKIDFFSFLKAFAVVIWALGPIFNIAINPTPISFLVSVVGYLLFAIVLYTAERDARTDHRFWVLFYPFLLLILLFVIARSVVNVFLFRKVHWRGRTYPVSSGK